MSTPAKEIKISKDKLLTILESSALPEYRYFDITLTFNEKSKKYQIPPGIFFHNGDYQRFKNYIMKEYHCEVEVNVD